MATPATFDISAPLTETFGAIVQPPSGSSALPDPGDVMRFFAERGAIILRGFPFTKASFTEFSNAACAGFSSYVGGGFRFRGLDRQSKDASGTVLSTTGSTQSFPIALHGEMYYQTQRPDVLWFFCEKAPARRGQTTVADGAALFAGLSDASKDLLRSRQLLYVRQLGAADWPTTFQTEDPEAMKRICAANGTSVAMAPDGSIRTEYRAAAIRPGRDGRETFINNALMLWQFEAGFRAGLASALLGDDVKQLPLVVRLDDGSELPASLVEDVERAGEACTVEIVWQEGDIAIVDNRRILHGRRKTGGEAREILVRLGELGAATAA